jgi:polyphosphate kinase
MSAHPVEVEPRSIEDRPADSAFMPPLLGYEHSILEFNRRVLAQARRADVPLLERLRYVAIVSSNLDEFFELRYAGFREAARHPGSGVQPVDVSAVANEAHALIAEQYAVLNDELMPALESAGIVLLPHARRDEAQRGWVARFFEEHVRPLLVPLGIDPAHPFPLVANTSLNFIVSLSGVDAFGRANPVAIVKVPRALPRVIRLPDALCGGKQGFVLLSSVIRAHLDGLFAGRRVESFSQFRVTRNAELDIDEDEAVNLRQALRSGLSTRNFGRAMRLEVAQHCPEPLWRFLLEQLSLEASGLYRVDGPVNLARMGELIALVDAPALRFAPYQPSWPLGRLPRGKPVFDTLRQRDVMLHHPFESFEPVVQFLRDAARDPDVLAIKLTIYRTGSDPVMIDLLIDAARRGKEVLVVVELKARFDEEANIGWAERLEAVGVQVVYGVVGLKTIAKMLLVTRREREGRRAVLRRYLHLSTGNYNPTTARLYTDVGYLTTDRELSRDADAVFRLLASQTSIEAPRHLVTAPFTLHERMLQHIAHVAEAARRGEAARIVVKVNGLTDRELIAALVSAARAGASIDLIVRGVCSLRPGVPGFTEGIRVRSLIGRFLEHSRIVYFRWGQGADDEVVYLTSADWMTRNMRRRIEVAWPVRDPALRQRVIDECLVPYLHDVRDTWMLGPQGRYVRIADDGISAQQALMQRFGG